MCGETFSPTQFALAGALAVLLATFFGIILPSAKVDDLIERISAALAGAAVEPSAIAAAAMTPIRLAIMSLTSRFVAPMARLKSTETLENNPLRRNKSQACAGLF